MHHYTQDNRPLQIRTPLPKDDLLIERVSGHEGVSSLFCFQLDLLGENDTDVPFEKLVGQEATVMLEMPENRSRYISGIISWFSQGERGTVFTTYRAELVPSFWFLTRTVQSRIYQNMTVPDILGDVLKALNPQYEWQDAFDPREYCVQYRESDFNFASRLMEEEGIRYFFTHGASGHRMVISNKQLVYPDVNEPSSVKYGDPSNRTASIDGQSSRNCVQGAVVFGTIRFNFLENIWQQ
jgi:type VI secretion system secreted protein VgrG